MPRGDGKLASFEGGIYAPAHPVPHSLALVSVAYDSSRGSGTLYLPATCGLIEKTYCTVHFRSNTLAYCTDNDLLDRRIKDLAVVLRS